MAKELIDVFAALENNIEEFCRISKATLLSRLQKSTELVVQIDEPKLRDLFEFPAPLTDADLALINAGCIEPGDTSARAKECRAEQRKLSQLINKQYNPAVINSVFLIATYFSIQLDKRYQQTISKIIEQKLNDIEDINGAFAGFYGGEDASYVENMRSDLKKLKLTNLSELFEQIIQNLNELADLFEKGKKIDFDEFALLFQRHYKLSQQCNILSAKIQELENALYLHNALLTVNRVYVSAPQESELQENQGLLAIKRETLANVQELIRLRVRPITAEGEDNPHYDPETTFYYARMLLLHNSSNPTLYTRIEYYLNLCLPSESVSKNNKIVACGMLYLLQIYLPKSKDKHQGKDLLSENLVKTALQLEEQPAEHTCGFGYVVGVLHHFSLIVQLRMHRKRSLADEINREILPICMKAAKKGFDFRALINQILSRGSLPESLFDFHIITHLDPIDPAISEQYAYILFALICQELGEYQLAVQSLDTQRESRFADIRIQEPIARINHYESISLFYGLVRTLEGEITALCTKNPENSEMPDIQSNIIGSVDGILQAKRNSHCLVEFLEIVRQNLEIITNAECDQRLIQNTIKQILDIINREYLIFSVNPDTLPSDLNKKIQEIKVFAPEVFQAYQDLARPFSGIMEYCCQQMRPGVKLSSNGYSMFSCNAQSPAEPPPTNDLNFSHS